MEAATIGAVKIGTVKIETTIALTIKAKTLYSNSSSGRLPGVTGDLRRHVCTQLQCSLWHSQRLVSPGVLVASRVGFERNLESHLSFFNPSALRPAS